MINNTLQKDFNAALTLANYRHITKNITTAIAIDSKNNLVTRAFSHFILAICHHYMTLEDTTDFDKKIKLHEIIFCGPRYYTDMEMLTLYTGSNEFYAWYGNGRSTLFAANNISLYELYRFSREILSPYDFKQNHFAWAYATQIMWK